MEFANKPDWFHWNRMRFVNAWQACLLSLDLNPNAFKPSSWPNHPPMFGYEEEKKPWFAKSSFTGVTQRKAYDDRLELIKNALKSPGLISFEPTTEENENLWLINLQETGAWALEISLPIPDEFAVIACRAAETQRKSISVPTVTGGAESTSVLTTSPSENLDWKIAARAIALSLLKLKPHQNLNRLANSVHEEMLRRFHATEKGMTGRGGRIPTAESIRRHVLIGIK